MRTIWEPSRQIPVADKVEVLVVGGGPAGFAAATAAARLGARVMLVERYGYLGGLATGGLVLYMDAIFDQEGERWINGLAWETLARLRAIGGLAEESPTRLHADSELLKIIADEMCVESGVILRLHSWGVSALVEGGCVKGIIVESKSGRQAILCRICIDATGDGDIAALAGAGYDMGYMRIGLDLKIGGVDLEAFRAFGQEERERAHALRNEARQLGGYALYPSTTPHSDIGVYWINVLGMGSREATAAKASAGRGSTTDTFAGELSAINVEDLSYAEVELRRKLHISLDFYRRNMPGFENVRLLAFASQLGVRDSRHIKGLHTLTKADVLAGKVFDDAIGAAAVPFADVGHYQIPYRCLVPEGVDGLLVAGRCICVDHWIIHSVRLIPPAMVTGQAAGTAAALAVQEGCAPREVDVAALRRQLSADDVII